MTVYVICDGDKSFIFGSVEVNFFIMTLYCFILVAISAPLGCLGKLLAHNHNPPEEPAPNAIKKVSNSALTGRVLDLLDSTGEEEDLAFQPLLPNGKAPFDGPGDPTAQDLGASKKINIPCSASCIGVRPPWFHTIVTCGCIRVTVIASNRQNITITGPQPALVSQLLTFVQNGVLYVQPRNMSVMLDMLDITVHVNRTDFGTVKIYAATASSVIVRAPRNIAGQWNLVLGQHPGSSITANINVRNLYTNVYNAGGMVRLSGRTDNHFIFVRGSASISASGLTTLLTDIDSIGSGMYYVQARQRISGYTEGAALVYFEDRYDPIVAMDGSGFQLVRRRSIFKKE